MMSAGLTAALLALVTAQVAEQCSAPASIPPRQLGYGNG